jgi:hypothetical protein
MKDIIIWILFGFLLIIILGLYISEYTPLNISEKDKILKMNIEYFSPSNSSSSQQETGASALYNWGIPDEISPTKKKKEECHVNCTPQCTPVNCPNKCPEVKCIEKTETNNELCKKCDITLNKDIEKYILKTSVPPCPDMKNFVTKNMIPPSVDMSKYILKSDIKPCQTYDLSKYILKTEIPACPTCPICPQCPICPAPPVCKTINEFNISEHNDMKDYMKKSDVERDYILKSKVESSGLCKNNKVIEETRNKVNHPTIINDKINAEYKVELDKLNKKQDEFNITINKNIENITKKQLEMDAKLEDPDGFYAGDSLYARF